LICFDPGIVKPAISGFLHNFVWGSVTAFLPLYAIQCGVLNPGHFFLAISVMMITCRAMGGRVVDAYIKEKIILACIITSIGAVIILSFSHTLLMFVIAGLIWGVGGAFIFPTSMAYALEYAGSSSGPSIGTFRALMDFGLTVGPMIMGAMIPLIGYRIMFLCLALICFINLNYFQFYVRRKGKSIQ
jgi:MFS family permease